jgi:hypothetical protein
VAHINVYDKAYRKERTVKARQVSVAAGANT